MSRLLAEIADPSHVDRLRQQAGDAPDRMMISLTLPPLPAAGDLLTLLPASRPFWYQASPAAGQARLGIGHAVQVDCPDTRHFSSRFAGLAHAWAGLHADWRHTGRQLAFAGFSFAPGMGSDWPDARLTVPAVLIEAAPEGCTLTLNATAGQLRQPGFAFPAWPLATPLPLPALLAEGDETAARRAWLGRVQRALHDISHGRLDKLVLCRHPRFRADGEISLPTLLGQMAGQAAPGFVYACSDGQRHFLGSTPERLLTLADGMVEADALAGTAWPGSPALADDKNRHEQSLVTRAITAALAPLCATPPVASPRHIHAAGPLQHWRTTVNGRLRPETSIFDVLARLHPTPAIGGFPGDAALAWLQAHGETRPAWYAGGIGWLDGDGRSEFHVGLRSACVLGRQIEFHAGAGIVAGSEAQRELAETEAKLRVLKSLFRCHRPATIAQQNDGFEAYT